MRFPTLISTAILATAGMVAALGSPASAHDGHSPAPGTDPSAMAGMAGMDHGAMAGMGTATTAPAQPSLSADVNRSRQRAHYFAAAMTGKQEVPVAGGPAVGDPDGSALGLIRIQGDRVTFFASWKNQRAATLFHIHEGPRGKNGPVKVGLLTTALPDTVTSVAGVTTIADATVADAIVARPGNFYLNLHTAEFPGGAARGQLYPVRGGQLLALLKGGRFEAFMSGDQEVPVAGGPAVGDPDGRAAGFVSARNGSLTYSFAWAKISEPTLGHIHRGVKGVNGAVVLPLFGTPMPEGVVAVSGTVPQVDPGLLTEIKHDPRGFYLNLHTKEDPGGAVRGQLFARR
ncbi:CHRD domain-containing protein [Actinoplanes subtropicus]|uniref:CHRD domain-containing protein n=1 Tax=Actinoplanes subtropicus TaxID=543632 RepID=UPI000555F4E9|nr:CHRD domain-containing protein [Actinoplanes subtropicus]